jgi:hypothetical protein
MPPTTNIAMSEAAGKKSQYKYITQKKEHTVLPPIIRIRVQRERQKNKGEPSAKKE